MRAIVTYHSIDPSGSPVSIARAAFESHIRSMRERGIAFKSLLEILGDGTPDPAVAITFDDGFKNFESEAWPILREHGVPTTVFVVSREMGRTNLWGGVKHPLVPEMPLLDWDAVGRLASEGCAIGSHSRSHPHLSALSDDAIADEIEGSKDDIKRGIGVAPTAFAYPFGDFDERSIAAARRHYRCALTTEMGPIAPNCDVYRLSRYDAHYLSGPGHPKNFGRPVFKAWVGLRSGLRDVRRIFTKW